MRARTLLIGEPQCPLWLTTPERGITAYMPVHLLDRDAEGW